jgi:hypothetical protein
MKILIRKSVAKEFYIGCGKWTTQRAHAQVFNDCFAALRECKERKYVHGRDVVLWIRDQL